MNDFGLKVYLVIKFKVLLGRGGLVFLLCFYDLSILAYMNDFGLKVYLVIKFKGLLGRGAWEGRACFSFMILNKL
jgi:hypothetical protein